MNYTIKCLMDNEKILWPTAHLDRYWWESYFLRCLALEQLNSEKNKVKGNFEDLGIVQIKEKIIEEFTELNNELSFPDSSNINFERALEELGDVAACLTGLLAKLLHVKNNLIK